LGLGVTVHNKFQQFFFSPGFDTYNRTQSNISTNV